MLRKKVGSAGAEPQTSVGRVDRQEEGRPLPFVPLGIGLIGQTRPESTQTKCLISPHEEEEDCPGPWGGETEVK